MDKKIYISENETETMDLGASIAKKLKKGDVLCLFGNLGSGKTTFVKGLAQGLNIKYSYVHSPSFTLMNIYKGRLPLYHFDLYRLDDIKNIEDLGCRDFIFGEGISVIEWAEKAKAILPNDYISFKFKHKSINKRVIEISGCKSKSNCLMLRKELKK